MSSETFFILKTNVDDVELIEVGGTPVVDSFDALKAAINQVAGRETADLFAEPVYRRGNDRAPAVISWYASVPEDAKPLGECEAEEREMIESKLQERLAPLQDGLGNQDAGALIGAALHVKDSGCIYSVGGRPLLVNWGMVPASIGLSPDRRTSHYQRTMGAFLPLEHAPPITPGEAADISVEQESAAATRPGASAATTTAGRAAAHASDTDKSKVQPAAPTSATVGAAHVTVSAEDSHVGRWRWIPLAVLLTLATALLIYLLIPGILIYPPETVVISSDESLKIAEEKNDSLRKRRDELRRALDEAVCLDDGSLRFPPPVSSDGTSGGDPVTSDQVVPPPPSRLEVPESEVTDGGQTDLLSVIEARTALVISEGIGVGSGFFVGPDLLVTNHHVVYGKGDKARPVTPAGVFVKNKALGRVIKAEILATSGLARGFGHDFTLLRVPGANAQYFPVWNSQAPIKLKPVYAAGFPGAYFKADQEGSALYDSKSPTVPDMVITQGTVNSQQHIGQHGVLSLIHSADISAGNSGGPLVDQCGRVVGVNTWGIQDEVTKRYLNLSQHTEELIRFAEKNGQTLSGTSDACSPRVAERQPAPREPAPDKPAPPAASDGVTPPPLKPETGDPGTDAKNGKVE